MERYTRAAFLKGLILLFWCLWIMVVVLMNLGDTLKVVGALPSDWQLASGNYEAIVKATSVYGAPHWLDFILFLGAIAWEVVAMLLFWTALRRWLGSGTRPWRAVYLAFSALFGLFVAFILADEICHQFRMEGDHRGIAVLLLASLLALQLLPERVSAR